MSRNPNNEPNPNSRGMGVGMLAAAGIVGGILIGVLQGGGETEVVVAEPAPTTIDAPATTRVAPAPTEAPTTTEADCDTSWKIVQLTTSDHRYVSEGLAEIRDAATNADARKAIQETWMGVVSGDPETLSGVAKVIMKQDVTPAELVDATGQCASPKAEEVRAQLDATLSLSYMAPAEAPTTGVNSGIDGEGNIGFSRHSGISGNRKAVLIVLPTGEKVWVMDRCGNIVTEDTPPEGMPPGDTDQPPIEVSKPMKYDDEKLPGSGIPADQDKGTPDKAGKGPAGQPVDPVTGTIATETTVYVAPAVTEAPQAPTTSGRPTASTTPAPTVTNPPAPATTTVRTTIPQSGPLPTQP